jgi:16S rRNA (uracil1498-N3)-methyltransferase
MPHFFINSTSLSNNIITICDKENYNHIAKSLRTKIGKNILLIDENQIQYECKIQKINSNSIEAEVIKSYKSQRKLDFELYLAQSPLRSDAQSLIVEKATELGIQGLFPVFTDNCALKKSVIEQKIEKWQKIMLEASKQCERANIPKCFELSSMESLIKAQAEQGVETPCLKINQFDKIFAFTERSAKFKLKDYLRANPILKNEKVLVIIGPEGGFSQKEFELLEKENITTLSLGELILKAETAVIVALGNIVL